MTDDIKPGEDVFDESDLGPSDDERRARRRLVADRVATTAAVTALGVWAGGLVALGACAAPFVFELTPYPFSGQAMGAAFRRFDSIAIGCGVVALGAEVVRTLAAAGQSQSRWMRVRRYLAIAMSVSALYAGMRLTPTIIDMHGQGVRRNVGARGAELERIHRQAELIGKATVPLAVVLIALHIFTGLRHRAERREQSDA